MNEPQIIYTITSLYIKSIRNEFREVVGEIMETGRCRTVGFYTDLEKAKKCVEEDWGAFNEAGYYNYIIIERVVEGLYNLNGLDLNDESVGEHWYRYENKWIPCQKPKMLFGTIGFGLG